MDKPATPGKNIPWAGKKVRPEQVEDELTFLWRLAADNMRISQNMNVRTSVLNLLICAPDTQTAYRVSSLLRDLSSTHIARVTLLILDQRDDAPSEVTTWVTLRSFPVISDMMRHHFEQVTVRLSGSAIQSAATIVQSLLKPDLPIYLWWTSVLPADTSVFSRLVAISDRAIIDSSDFQKPAEHIQLLPSLLQQAPECALSDFNWSRVTPWRELIAQFSDVGEYRPYLVNVEKVEIEHAVTSDGTAGTNEALLVSPNPVRALFLAAWIKTRLGWPRSSKISGYADHRTGNYGWRMKERAITGVLPNVSTTTTLRLVEELEITIRPRVQATLRPGNICLIRAVATYEGKQATFIIDRDDDEHVITRVELPESTHPRRIVNIAATHKESDILSDELEIMGHDQLYEEILREVNALLTE